MEYVLGIIVEAVKRSAGTDTFATHLLLFAVSVAGAGLYVFISATALWPVVLAVLVIIRKFEA